MSHLLDSHAFVWFMTGSERCSARARGIILDPANRIFVSAVSAWEIATKVRLGKWPEAAEIANDMPDVLAERNFVPLDMTPDHGRLAGFLPGDHRDPFDRMLVAQAKLEGLSLVSADRALAAFDVSIIW